MANICILVMLVSFLFLTEHAIVLAFKDDKYSPLAAVLIIIASCYLFSKFDDSILVKEGKKELLNQVTVAGESRFRVTIEYLYVDGELKSSNIVPYSIRKCYPYEGMVWESSDHSYRVTIPDVVSRKIVRKKVPIRRAD